MTDGQMKKVIVVLSAGRSGTSLLMNALSQLNMSLSENLIPGNLGNPDGHFEDADIGRIHKQLHVDLRTHPYLPLPAGWQKSPATREAEQKLNSVITEHLQGAKTIWGFKNPGICSFLPLWARVFNPTKVVPTFILAVRNPASVVTSFRRQYNDEESLAELVWLQRNCDALYHTAADCFIVHYEEWFTHPGELARGLLDYTGLSEYSGGKDLDEVLKGLIKPDLNRAQYEDYAIKNQYVAKLYTQLRQCHGNDFDRKALMEVVKECRNTMEQFEGWAGVANKHGEPLAKQKELEAELKKAVSENKELEAELEKAVSENNNLLQQVKDLFDEVGNLRRQIASVSSSNRPGQITETKTRPKNTFLPQREGLIVFAKRRVASLLPGIYRYYKRGIVRRF